MSDLPASAVVYAVARQGEPLGKQWSSHATAKVSADGVGGGEGPRAPVRRSNSPLATIEAEQGGSST